MSDEVLLGRSADRAAQIEAIVDHLPALVAYWDSSMRNTFANSAYTDIFGKTPAQIHGMHVTELFGVEGAAQIMPYIEAALEGRPQHFERTIVDHRGTPRCIRASYIPDVVHGSVIGAYVHGTDVTELMAAKRAKRHSAEQIAALTERARIADRVHGVVLQLLFAATLELGTPSGPRVESAVEEIHSAISELRKLITVPLDDDGRPGCSP